MPSYLSLIKWTEQGIRDIKQSPARLDAVKEAARAAGGRVVFFYLTLGDYDIATLMELPNDEAAARLLLTIGGQGNVRTTTLKAFTEAEYRTIIAGLP
ncbi:MAG: GYD domain-containing protein [Chloroflexi bacterium]|nr:GYD domain-containing protein [Chloroflexota bacterium]MBI4197849.1 GYD domain-containing protein [Chloroflexota bacterium]